LKFAHVEPKQNQALLRSNLTGIGSPDEVSIWNRCYFGTCFFL